MMDDSSSEQENFDAALLEMLVRATGDEQLGESMHAQIMLHVDRAYLPANASELRSFVNTYVLPRLAEELGERMARIFADDWLREQGPVFDVRSSSKIRSIADFSAHAPEVLDAEQPGIVNDRRQNAFVCDVLFLLLPDRFERGWLARTLIQVGYEVRAFDTLPELFDAVSSGELPSLLILVPETVETRSELSELSRLLRRVPVLALTKRDVQETKKLLLSLGFASVEALSRSVPSAEVVSSVRVRVPSKRAS